MCYKYKDLSRIEQENRGQHYQIFAKRYDCTYAFISRPGFSLSLFKTRTTLPRIFWTSHLTQ